MHLIVLAGKLDKPVPIIERLVSSNTADAILLYPEIDDRYSEDPLIAGLQAYKLDIPSRKASYSDTGPKSELLVQLECKNLLTPCAVHLPLALGILEVIKDKNSPALKLLLERARVKKIDKIVQAYERAGVQSRRD